MCADRRQTHDLSHGMGDGPATTQVVRGTAGRRRHHDSVALHHRPEHIVHVDVEAAHELTVTPGHSDLVQGVAFGGLVLGLAVRINVHLLGNDWTLGQSVFDGAGEAGSILHSYFSEVFASLGEACSV